ncbi:hypothetical protein [Mariniphaga sp.]|uniref:hypothetical protein n=1 Tax=Mariniphaga sp. TaxID=1954475 RepID=UPI0035662E73
MKKILIVLSLAFLATSFLHATAMPAIKSALGEWKFESPYAPDGYNKGSIIISEKEGVLAGEIKFADGTKVELKDVKFEENILKFGINVEYNYIPIKATIEGNKMKGTANTPDGDLPFEATKVEKTE